MSPIEIDAGAYTRAAEALRAELPRTAGAIAAKAGTQAANAIRRNVRREAPRVTGKLRSHVRVRRKGRGWAQESLIYAGGGAAHFVILGTKAHVIPGRAGVRGVPIGSHGNPSRGWAGRFTHHGTAPNPFFSRGVDAAASDLQTIANNAATATAEALAVAAGKAAS